MRTGAGASFSVQVLPPHGERLPAMLVVEMDNLSGGNTRIQSVAGDGVARFEEIAGGSYTVRLRADEYEPSEQTVFVPPATRGRSTLILTLGPRRTSGEARPNPMNPVVRAETLAVPAKAVKEFDKALAESERRRAQRAVVHLERALKIHPTYFDALTLLATQLVHLRRLPEAADALERCLSLRPEDASTRFNLGLVALELDDRPRARHQLSKAAELDPENATAYFYIGETCFRMGRLSRTHSRVPAGQPARKRPPGCAPATRDLLRARPRTRRCPLLLPQIPRAGVQRPAGRMVPRPPGRPGPSPAVNR